MSRLSLRNAAAFLGFLTQSVEDPAAYVLLNVSATVPKATGYPLAEFTDVTRLHPEREGSMLRALAYFKTLSFAPFVTCPVLLRGTGPAMEALAQRITGHATVRQELPHVHELYQREWLANALTPRNRG